MYADILKKIVNHYDYYKNIAVNLEWTVFNSGYYEWHKNHHVVIFVTVCDFSGDYVKNNFEQAYVQTVLTYMAYMEEFKEDFRNTPSAELLKYMTQAEDFYANYITYKELRMKQVTEEYLINEIWLHAVYNSVPERKVNSLIPYLAGAENIEIGGFYPEEHTFISIKDTSIMLFEFIISY
ncbi:MAG: hypothetical protein K2O36_05940 [Ruminococcus sp.]|nr:hypothetical protein [Ruminococcus sp.]